MELEVFKRPIFKPTVSIVMIQQFLWWERQKRSSRTCKIKEPWQRNTVLIFGGVAKHVIVVKSPLFGAWWLLMVHVQFTPSERAQRLLKNVFFRNLTMKKDRLTWDFFVVRDVNSPKYLLWSLLLLADSLINPVLKLPCRSSLEQMQSRIAHFSTLCADVVQWSGRTGS